MHIGDKESREFIMETIYNRKYKRGRYKWEDNEMKR